MKTKLRILVFLTLFFCLTVTPVSLHAIVDIEDVPVVTNDLPSTSYLKKEKRSIAVDVHSSALVAPAQTMVSLSSSSWNDPFMVGQDEWSNAANVGAPVGDVSLPIILSILFLYMIYRGVTTSKRRNNF